MTWVGWRLQRMESLTAALVLAMLAILFIPAGLHMATAFTTGDLSACVSQRTPACGAAVSGFLDHFSFVRGVLDWLRLVPGIIGALLATPLVLELENGTYRLAWTQGITRGRLLIARLTVALVTALFAAAAFSLLLTWSRGPLDALVGRMNPSSFDIEGTVPLACALFALGLTFAIGVALRRTGVALVLGFAGYIACRILVDTQLRPRYVTPVTQRFSLGTGLPTFRRDFVLSQHLVDRAGRPFTITQQIVAACSHTTRSGSVGSCLAHHGAAFMQAVYQPAGRFWLFQGIETALFGTTGLALVVVGGLWLQRRAS